MLWLTDIGLDYLNKLGNGEAFKSENKFMDLELLGNLDFHDRVPSKEALIKNIENRPIEKELGRFFPIWAYSKRFDYLLSRNYIQESGDFTGILKRLGGTEEDLD
jgi:hypothetical protein